MTPSDEYFADQRASVRAQAEQARQRNAALRDLAQSLQSMQATVRSADGAVTVTAMSTGAITKISLAEGALDRTATALSATVEQTIAKAQREALAVAARHAATELGDTHPLVDDLRTSQDRFARPDDDTLRDGREG